MTTKSKIAEFILARENNIYDYRVFSFDIPVVQYQKISSIHPELEGESLSFAREALIFLSMEIYTEESTGR